ncbi:24228_t:CDS:2 [Dentiscutata erythropus]|uniref:24228_t:CDS:1 n=1 Tax=Dentiscutata erythropus TaxID=1348616 RepID=A0A9N9PAA7_9GLOM|nr:24228_t:CDS:2 [Dentiscutata erythropus]
MSKTSLEETIRKILQSEFKLIFPAIFSPNANSDSSPVVSEQIQEKINNTSPGSKDSTPDEVYFARLTKLK